MTSIFLEVISLAGGPNLRDHYKIPDAIRKIVFSSCQSNQDCELVEEFIQTVLAFEKQIVRIRKKHTLEYLKLLNFFSAGYGKYKIGKDGVQFSYEIENKLCESYFKNIMQLLKEERDTILQMNDLTQKLREKMFQKKTPPCVKTEVSEIQ